MTVNFKWQNQALTIDLDFKQEINADVLKSLGAFGQSWSK